MSHVFGLPLGREEAERYLGDLSQIAGFQRVALTDGLSRGVRAINVWNGSGLEFTVVVDRGLDITHCRFCGIPLAWRSPVGEAHPHTFDPRGFGWLNTFPGGLVTTCGLTQAGAPCVDDGEELGLHGRFSHLPAEDVRCEYRWEGEDLTLVVSGKVREWRMFGPNLLLQRQIRTKLGVPEIIIEDEVRNEGTKRTPLMLLYHVNLGWPVVNPSGRLLCSQQGVRPRDREAEKGFATWDRLAEPVRAFAEQVFYIDHRTDPDGFVDVALVNPDFPGGGIGVHLRYRKEELPRFTLWKQLDEREYVVGLEPANCWVEGRARERSRDGVEFLDPGQARHFLLEIRTIRGDEIAQLQRELTRRS